MILWDGLTKEGGRTKRGRDYFRGIQTQECSQNIALKLGKKDNNDNDNTFQGFHQLLFVLLVILSPIHVNFKLFSSSFPQSRSTECSLGLDFSSHDEIILLSAIFPILLISYWGYYGVDNRH